jgi:hypothetical protein
MNTKNLQTLILFIILVIVLCCVYNIERFTNNKMKFKHLYYLAYRHNMGLDQVINLYKKKVDNYKYPFNLKKYYYAI